VIYVKMVFVVIVHYKEKEKSEVLSRSFVFEVMGISNIFRLLNLC